MWRGTPWSTSAAPVATNILVNKKKNIPTRIFLLIFYSAKNAIIPEIILLLENVILKTVASFKEITGMTWLLIFVFLNIRYLHFTGKQVTEDFSRDVMMP